MYNLIISVIFVPKLLGLYKYMGTPVGYVLHTTCPEIYCLRLIDEYCENYAEILCVIVYCILHRHVPETEFGTGNMKYLPILLTRVLQTSCFQKPYQMKNTFLLVYRNAMTSFSHFDTSKYLLWQTVTTQTSQPPTQQAFSDRF